MEAHENSVRQLLEPTKQFIVPLFQRFYVWETKSWDTLWDDLLELSADDSPHRSHFIGAVVVMPASDDTRSLPKYTIIDGQQRIATLLVLLIAMRDYARKNNTSRLAEEIENTFLINQYKDKDSDDYYKLLLSQTDRVAFQHLLHSDTTRLNHLLCQCYNFYANQLRKLDNRLNESPSLKTLFNAVVNRLTVVAITLTVHDNPYMVFEGLNFRGRRLTEADLIRNYLFMMIPPHQQQALYEQHWLPMQTALGDNLASFTTSGK